MCPGWLNHAAPCWITTGSEDDVVPTRLGYHPLLAIALISRTALLASRMLSTTSGLALRAATTSVP